MSRLLGRRSVGCLTVLAALLTWVPPVVAQSAIAGVVTDASGGVMPGVTVEARSPALIEQSKSAVTDEHGQYRIIELRPGEYSVTFSLAGFTTVVREGIELGANFTAPIHVQMKVGTLEETVTVSGESPVVDVQTTSRREVVSRELIEVLPQGRNYQPILASVPGVVSADFDVGGSQQTQQNPVSAYGGQTGDMAFMIDGMNTATAGLSAQGGYIDQGTIQDYDIKVSGGNAEVQSPGVNLNIIPREGGNQITAQGVALWSHPNLQSDNLTEELQAAGARGAPSVDRMYDYGVNMGGPILKNRLWFFGSARTYVFDKTVFNLFHDGKVGPEGASVVDSGDNKDFSLRLTGQLSTANKLTVFYNRNYKTLDYRQVGSTLISSGLLRPEAAPIQTTPNAYIAQVKWTSTLTNQLLLQVGWSRNNYGFLESLRPENRTPDQLPPFGDVAKQEITGTSQYGAGVLYGAPAQFTDRNRGNDQFVSSLTYVTGTHNLKGGVTYWPRGTREFIDSYAAVLQRYSRGVPNSVTLYNTPTDARTQYARDWGLYIQDSWTLNRLTVNPGLRWDYDRTYVPAQESAAGRWVPARSYPLKNNLPSAWTNWQPRFGAAFDLFGTAKTVVKGSLGRYVTQTGQPYYNDLTSSTDTRNWNDLNGNDIAEANELGPSQNLSFGIRSNTEADPNLKRPGQTLYNLSLEHELKPGLGVAMTYTRRSYWDVTWTNNLATTFDDYTLVSVPDPRGNGELLPVYNLASSKVGVIQNLDTTSDQNTRIYNGFDVSVRGRLPNGGQFQGGTSTGRDVTATCQTANPNRTSDTAPGLRFCDQRQYDVPYRTRFRLSGTYPLPKDFRFSAVYQNLDGAERVILYQVTRTQVPNLTVSTVPVRLNEPGSSYLGRVQQLDFNIARTFRTGRIRMRPQIDFFNALNAAPVLSRQNTFGPTLDQPLTILMGRLVRLGLQVDF